MASTPFGGYGSKAAQSAALAKAMAASYAAHPEAWRKAGTTPSKLTRQQNAVQQAKQAQQARINAQKAQQQAFQTKLNQYKEKPFVFNTPPIINNPWQGKNWHPKHGWAPHVDPAPEFINGPPPGLRNPDRITKPKSIFSDSRVPRVTPNPTQFIPTPPPNPKPRIEITDLQGKPIDTGDMGLIRKPDGTTDITGVNKTSKTYKNLMQGDVLLKGMTNTSKNPTPGVSTLGEMAITDNYSLGGPRNLVSRNKIPKTKKPSLKEQRQAILDYYNNQPDEEIIPNLPLDTPPWVLEKIKREKKK